MYLALVVIVVRGPLAFVPEATAARFNRWFFSTAMRLRLVGVAMLVLLAAPLIVATRITPPAHPDVVWFERLGWLVVVVGAVLIARPEPICRLARALLTGVPTSVLRILGVVNIAFGIFLAWIAVAVL
jgi:uncharacterized protein YjeT (DUF2065 family)